jgi:NMD protein affecting ribosome stability and mRNA decay
MKCVNCGKTVLSNSDETKITLCDDCVKASPYGSELLTGFLEEFSFCKEMDTQIQGKFQINRE